MDIEDGGRIILVLVVLGIVILVALGAGSVTYIENNNQVVALTPLQVQFTVTPSNGIAPYTYQWYSGGSCSNPIGGQTANVLTVSSHGTYSVLVTDSKYDTTCAIISG